MDISIPKTFKQGANKWKVVYATEAVAKKKYSGDPSCLDDACGLCSSKDHTIYLIKREGDTPDTIRQTFIHEALHAAMDTIGLEDHDEQLIEGVSQMLFQMLSTCRGVIKID